MALPKNCAICDDVLTRKNRASSPQVADAGRDYDDMCGGCFEVGELESEHEDGGHAPDQYGVTEGCPMCNADEDDAKGAAKVASVAVAPISDASAARSPLEGPGLEAGKSKGRKLLADAVALGWALGSHETIGERFELELANEETGETISIAWNAGVCDAYIPYSYGGRTVKLKNASAVRKRMSQAPDVIAPRKGRTSEGDQVGGTRVLQRSVPFDPEHTNLEELRAKLGGKTIRWMNSLDNRLIEEARVRGFDPRYPKTPVGGKQFALTSGEAGRAILQFVDAEVSGFRAVALDQILQVV